MVDEKTYERELGGINAKLEYLVDGQDKLFSRLDNLDRNGCAKGKANAERIEKVESWPHKWASTIISLLAGVGAAIAIWRH